jgi:CubicO group peptidase (beta-lactamase class C family)
MRTHSKSRYATPEELQPVWTWNDGYSATETKRFRRIYSPIAATTADDAGSYSSSRLSEVRNTTVVHRIGQVSNLESEPIPAIGDVTATTILGTMALEEMMDDPRSRMKAIAVIHDGKVAFEKYIGIRIWDNHLWASATKILSGTLMHIAEEEGLVDLNSPVTAYLPELNGTDWEDVMVEDVLHQRSGLDISESRLDSSPDHPVTLLYAIAAGDTSLPPGTSLIEAVKVCKKHLEPGTRYEYASINTFVATLILESVYDIPVEDLVTARIWGKSGMEGDGLLGLSASGEPMLFGAFAARLRDLARFGMLFTPSWEVIANEQVVSDAYFDKVQKAAKPEVYGKDYMSERLINHFDESGFGASYQWDAVFADGDMYKSGRFGQCLYVSPETNTAVVWYSSAYKAEVWVHAYAREIVKQIFR